MKVAILVFDRFTALDAVGPYEVLSRLPGAEVTFVAEQPGVVTTDTGALSLTVQAGIANIERADILLVPGGPGTDAICDNALVLGWVRSMHETTQWTTSVCTGALILGAARLLHAVPATTHWLAMEALAAYGAQPVHERIVEHGKIVSAAGVSAGIDMALHLAGRIGGPELAQAIQLGIEYDPQPPFDAGSPDKAPKPVVEIVRTMMTQRSGR